jgi:cytochrome oxidase Cu insertion factor (SCO1/SenC/PrrC family)
MKYIQSKNNHFIFIILIVIFLTPLIVAVLLYHKNPLWLHQKTVNKGYLLALPWDLHQIKLISANSSSRTFKQSWFLFYLASAPCREYCQKNLHTLRQVTLALGKNASRVNYGVIVANHKSLTSRILISKDSDLLVYRISKPGLEKYFVPSKMSQSSDGYYLADPFGKIILYYSSTAPGEEIYQDLSRLLSISTTG